MQGKLRDSDPVCCEQPSTGAGEVFLRADVQRAGVHDFGGLHEQVLPQQADRLLRGHHPPDDLPVSGALLNATIGDDVLLIDDDDVLILDDDVLLLKIWRSDQMLDGGRLHEQHLDDILMGVFYAVAFGAGCAVLGMWFGLKVLESLDLSPAFLDPPLQV